MWLLGEQRSAYFEHFYGSETLANPWVSALEPIGENTFRAIQHRLDFPERVVEVEADRADRVKHIVHVIGGNVLDEMLLIMGNRNYSSWSLRPWLLMKHVGLEFSERVIPLDTPEFEREVATISPTLRVPVLRHGTLLVWDSLAICEYACELAGRGWPALREARAMARAACAEMHSGFPALRSQWPMNARATGRRTAPNAERSAEIGRIESLWADCRTRFGAAGPWLFGEFSVADAMYAPVVLRLRTYGATVRDATAAYMATVLADAHMREWLAAAAAEGWTSEEYEIG
jgi:glutathione S-transferase